MGIARHGTAMMAPPMLVGFVVSRPLVLMHLEEPGDERDGPA
jgi:hypothetical protein